MQKTKIKTQKRFQDQKLHLNCSSDLGLAALPATALAIDCRLDVYGFNIVRTDGISIWLLPYLLLGHNPEDFYSRKQENNEPQPINMKRDRNVWKFSAHMSWKLAVQRVKWVSKSKNSINDPCWPVRIFWNAVSTFVESKAEVSMKDKPFFSAKALASSVGTARKCLKSDLLPTSMMTMFWSAWSLSSLSHRSTFS